MSLTFLPRLVLGLVCAGGPASADILYSTFGPGDTFNGLSVQWIGATAGIPGGTSNDRQVANRFTVSSDAEVTGYRVAISHYSVPPGHGLGELSLWTGDTAPTTQLESDILFDTGPGSALILAVPSVFHPLLSSGMTYWLVLSAPAPELYRWYDALAPVPAGSARLYRDDSTAGAWDSAGAWASAFEIDGVVGGVPEPGGWLLLASVLVLTAMIRARRLAR